jgi:hypothetical protein
MRRFWKFGLKEQKGEKLEFVAMIERSRPAIECTSARAPKARIERTCVRTRKETDRSVIKRTKCDRAHLCMKPTLAAALFWKFLVFRVLVTLCCTRIQPYDFRVSRTLLDSINWPVNTKKHTLFWRRIYSFQGSYFSGLFFLLLYFMKMISINFICN